MAMDDGDDDDGLHIPSTLFVCSSLLIYYIESTQTHNLWTALWSASEDNARSDGGGGGDGDGSSTASGRKYDEKKNQNHKIPNQTKDIVEVALRKARTSSALVCKRHINISKAHVHRCSMLGARCAAVRCAGETIKSIHSTLFVCRQHTHTHTKDDTIRRCQWQCGDAHDIIHVYIIITWLFITKQHW